MTDLTPSEENIPALTLKQARTADEALRSGAGQFAVQLYLFHAQKGYKSLGYDTFFAYCQERLDLTESTAYRWLDRVKATLTVHNLTVSNLLENCHDGSFDRKLLPAKTSAELNKLPTAEQVRSAWNEYETICNHEVGTESQTFRHLKMIVGRYLGRTQPEAATPPVDKPFVVERPVAPKVFIEPTNAAPTILPEPLADEDEEDEIDPNELDDRAREEYYDSPQSLGPPIHLGADAVWIHDDGDGLEVRAADDLARFSIFISMDQIPQSIAGSISVGDASSASYHLGKNGLVVRGVLNNGAEVSLFVPREMLPEECRP
jgi:hypothetical protein